MDKRLLDILACPACHSELSFSGESDGRRLVSGELACFGCGLAFPVEDQIAILVPAGTDMHSADWEAREGIDRQMEEWVQRNFSSNLCSEFRQLSPYIQDFVNAVRVTGGPVIDVASGPGGSCCVSAMEHGGTDGLFVMSDLGKPVVTAWRHQLREVGWADRCSLMVFDARRMPFGSGTIPMVTSVGGMQNIRGDRRAYQEAARVLRPNGCLLDSMILFEEGGQSQRELSEFQATSTWPEYESLLRELELTVEHWELVSSKRGKPDPEDDYPKNNETWEMRMVFATRNP